MANELDLPAEDLHLFMKNKDLENVGLLWNDTVHFTSFGQKLVAEFMSDAIARQLSSGHTLRATATE